MLVDTGGMNCLLCLAWGRGGSLLPKPFGMLAEHFCVFRGLYTTGRGGGLALSVRPLLLFIVGGFTGRAGLKPRSVEPKGLAFC